MVLKYGIYTVVKSLQERLKLEFVAAIAILLADCVTDIKVVVVMNITWITI